MSEGFIKNRIAKMIENRHISNEMVEAIRRSGLKPVSADYYRLEFKDLMKSRIDKILIVCSLYDFYTIVEDGQLQEAIFNEYLELNLYYAPHITRAYSGEAALRLVNEEKFDLIITASRLGDIELQQFVSQVKAKYPEIPLVLLASHSRELQVQIDRGSLTGIDKIFTWSGDRKVFLAIIKLFEDMINAPSDCLNFGVTAILLVEDSPAFYSSYLPLIYTEVMKQSQKLIEEGKNSAEKLLRQRARPKILHAESYEQAWQLYETYRSQLLGIITDMKFQRNGSYDDGAGIELIKNVKKIDPLLPIILQTSNPSAKEVASILDVGFLDKNTRTLLTELREFMKNNFGFGDFVFRTPNNMEINRARNLRELRDRLRYIPDESLVYHSQNNHFSHWLIARTQFELAYKIRPVHISQFNNTGELRNYLITIFTNQLAEDQRGVITVFSRSDYDAERKFQLIGEGSLGGKARGLAFIDNILKKYLSESYFPNVKISIPRTIVLGTDVFDQFMENNNLHNLALQNISDERILHEFLSSDLPATVLGDLREVLKKVKYPLAVRSSSLLEDAVYQPFAGIFATVMIPNSNPNIEVRFQNLVQAIKLVYASTYSKKAKNYIEATGNFIEEEKMAVIIQELVGSKFSHYFYPHFSGVARSYNYYPFARAKPCDGTVSLALGLGKTIVDGDLCLQYSPAYPGIYPQFSNNKDLLSKSQVKFWALDLNSDIVRRLPNEDMYLVGLGIKEAEQQGSLNYITSTYVAQSDYLYEGLTRQGPRILNFAPILKSNVFPLNDIIKLLLRMSDAAMNCPVEIEFATTVANGNPPTAEFRFLQVRPMVKPEGNVEIDRDSAQKEDILLYTEMALGNGVYSIERILFVKPDKFDSAKTRLIAAEINQINQKLLKEDKPYMLIGMGRWGSSDSWLGIPVDFSNISAAQVIVEIPMTHIVVDPSQGSHFFHNITSFKIAYLTLKNYTDKSIDWDWLNQLPAVYETDYIKLVEASRRLEVRVDGQSGKAIALKPN